MVRNLITGGLGFIGSQLARTLIKDGEEVVIFDVTSSSKLIKAIEHEVKIVQGDLSNWSEVLHAVGDNGINCIYHLGALKAYACEASPPACYAANINGTFHVLEAARLFKVVSVMFPSTLSVFGLGAPLGEVVNEDVVQLPNTMYGLSKVVAERLGVYYHAKFGINFRCVRYPVIMGPGRASGPPAYTSRMIDYPALGRPYQANVDESLRVPIMYVKDAVSALVCLKRADEAGLKRRIYNLGGFFVTAGEEADIVRKYLPGAQIEFRPDKPTVRLLKSMSPQMDDTRACQEWGLQPKRSLDNLEEVVKDFINEVQTNRALYE